MLSKTCLECIKKAEEQNCDPLCIDSLNYRVSDLIGGCLVFLGFYWGLLGEVEHAMGIKRDPETGFRLEEPSVSLPYLDEEPYLEKEKVPMP